MVHVGVVLLIIINLLIKPTVLTAMVRSTELYVENVCQNVVRVHSRYPRPDPAVSVKRVNIFIIFVIGRTGWSAVLLHSWPDIM